MKIILGDSKCTNCGARVGRFRRKCPKCGEKIHRRKLAKQYTGVRMQQGRVATDDDWGEVSRVGRKAQKIATVNCASCGAINTTRRARCKNCGANL